jgi:hypothetical protein
MPRRISLARIKKRATRELAEATARHKSTTESLDYLLVRWIAQMTAVEFHAAWERYVEDRLVVALNHNPEHFLEENDIKGVRGVSSGLASYIVRGGGRYFDFRSMSDLLDKTDRWIGKEKNPFRSVPESDRLYLDALAAIRNRVVHQSAASNLTYKRSLKSVYGIKSAPLAEEFLHAKDYRKSSPARYESRLGGLAAVVRRAIEKT